MLGDRRSDSRQTHPIAALLLSSCEAKSELLNISEPWLPRLLPCSPAHADLPQPQEPASLSLPQEVSGSPAAPWLLLPLGIWPSFTLVHTQLWPRQTFHSCALTGPQITAVPFPVSLVVPSGHSRPGSCSLAPTRDREISWRGHCPRQTSSREVVSRHTL